MTDLIGPASAPNSTTTRPALYRIFGAVDTWFRDCSTPASQDGTAYQADFFNGLLGQVRRLIRGNGNLLNGTGPVVTEDNTSDALILTAVQLLIARGQPNAGADTGSADALAVGPATPWPEYVKGARIWVIKSSAAGPNATATPTLAVSSLQPVTIVRRDGSALLPGDLPAGGAFVVEFDGTTFRLVSLTWGEIASAVQSGKWVYGAATGTGNAAAVTLFPGQAPLDGTEILVKWPAANTATAPTLTVAGLGTKAVLRQGGGTIQPADIAGYVPLIWDATLGAWRVNGFVASDIFALFAVRIRLTANLNIYVSPTGSDTANTGLTPASPFATLQKAYNYVQQTYDFNGYTITINAAGGTYTAGVSCNAPVSGTGTVVFNGNIASPSTVVVNVNNASCFSSFAGANIAVQGFQLGATGTAIGQGSGVYAQGGNIIFANCIFGNCAQSQVFAQLGSSVAYGPSTFSGNGFSAFQAQGYGTIGLSGYTMTFGGGTYSVAVASAVSGQITAVGTIFSGTAGGKRYQSVQSATIQTNGGGANYFPGNAAGTQDTTSSYS